MESFSCKERFAEQKIQGCGIGSEQEPSSPSEWYVVYGVNLFLLELFLQRPPKASKVPTP